MSLILLGSTGSIGSNTLKVAKEFGIPIEVLGAGRNIALLNEQIKATSPKAIIIQDSKDKDWLQPNGARVYIGEDGLKEAIFNSSSKLLVNAISGGDGLRASILAKQANKTIALANKESLVSAGWLFDTASIIPVDSEHFSLWHLLKNQNLAHISSLIITASGGAFRDTPLKDIPNKSKEDALKHPNWKMGTKITIDSASMVNKLFELLEAYWLFSSKNPHLQLDAIIERSSNIHALIGHIDGSFSAHLSHPDMCLAIAYALDSHKAAQISLIPKLNLKAISHIQFQPIDCKRYPIWNLKTKLLENPKLGIALNAANEVLVHAFLNHQIPFGSIATEIIQSVQIYEHKCLAAQNFEDVMDLDMEIKAYIRQKLA